VSDLVCLFHDTKVLPSDNDRSREAVSPKHAYM